MKLGILKSYKEIDFLTESYAAACKYCGVDYVILDLLADDWIVNIQQANVDGILVRERASLSEYKSMYDERLWTIKHYLHIPIYPDWHELYLYENKRMYSYYFESHKIKTPETHVFYRKALALKFCSETEYPIVFKTNGGAGGSGVRIIHSKKQANRIINNIFGRFDPRMALGNVLWSKYKGIPVPKLGMSQRHYVIIQKYIDIETEWRIIKIGDTYAGYQRPVENGHGSCSEMIFGFPPIDMLQLIKHISENDNIGSLSLDVLVSKDGQYYVTEMQTLYGSFNNTQCAVNGVAGRIIFKNNNFTFEPGDNFFILNSNVLRVKDFVARLNNEQKSI